MSDIQKYQDEILEWSTRNFGRPVELKYNIEPLLILMSKIGILSHCVLKTSQGIRGTREEHEEKFKTTVVSIETFDLENLYLFLEDTAARSSQVDFDCSSLLGIIEEVGELCKAILNADNKEFDDAIADIMVYLLDFCGRNNRSSYELLDKVWNKVKSRDWKKNPNDAHLKENPTTVGVLAGGTGKAMSPSEDSRGNNYYRPGPKDQKSDPDFESEGIGRYGETD